VIDDPDGGRDRLGERLQHGVYRGVVAERQMNSFDVPDRRRRVGEGVRAVGFERIRLNRIAVPDIHLMAAIQHAANEAGAHQAGAKECNSQRVSPAATIRRLYSEAPDFARPRISCSS